MATIEAIEVKLDEGDLQRLERMLLSLPGAMPRVVSRALNRTLTSVRSRIVKRIASILPVTQARIRKSTRIVRASRSRWQGVIVLTGKAIPLIEFGARQSKAGVTHKAIGGDGRTLRERAFIAVMPRGHRGVFRRKPMGGARITAIGGRERLVGRLPIAEQFGPSIPSIFQTTPGMESWTKIEASDTLRSRLEHEANFELEKAAGRIGRAG